MGRDRLVRALLAALALATLAAGVEAQKGRGGRGGRKAAGAAPAVGAPAKPGATKKSELPPLTLPGLTPPGGAKKGEGKQPDLFEALFGKGKADPKEAPKDPKAAPPKPPKPMEPADEVTAAADHVARQAEIDARRVREHFGVCDLDQNGWLSLREAEVTLSLSRDEYRRADANQDGRLEPAEFEAQQSLLLTRMGVPSPEPAQAEPAPAPEPPADPGPTPPPVEPESGSSPAARAHRAPTQFDSLLVHPVDLLRRYDADDSKGIGVSEVEKLLNEIGLALSAEMVVAQMDPNDSGELGARELTPLAWLTSKHLPESLRPELVPAPAAPEATDGALPVPPAPTLTTHFARLDPDHDGAIGESDLRALQGNVRLEVRLRAVLSAMDADGDGRLTEAEFASSMRRGSR